MEQATDTASFFDGYSARPAPVRVQLFGGRVHLHDPYDDRFIQSFALQGSTHNHVGNQHFLYLHPNGLVYLRLDGHHPLAASLGGAVAAAHTGPLQRLMRQKLLLLVPLLLALAAGLYFLLLLLVPFLGMRLIGRDAETALGNRLHQVMLQELSLVGSRPDTAGTARLQAFAAGLQLSSRYAIRLTLLNSSVVNAYALPGGQVVVHRGILEKIKTPEALVALLAHESTHVNERHSLRSLLRSSANSLLVSILLGDATAISGALAGNLENLSGLHYSRGLESEADRNGMELMRANGVPPQGMVQLMRTLQQEGAAVPDGLTFLSSHPLTHQRIRAAEAYCRRHKTIAPANPELTQLFAVLKAAIK